MAASLKLTAERANKRSFGIKHEDRWVVFAILLSLVDHIEVARLVEGHTVSCLPGEAIGELWEVVLHAKLVLALADDGFVGEPAGPREGGRSGRGGRCRGEAGGESAAGEGGASSARVVHEDLLERRIESPEEAYSRPFARNQSPVSWRR